MGKRNKQIEKIEAAKLVGVLAKNKFKVNKTARELGITHGALCQRISRKPVQTALQKIAEQHLKKAGATIQKIYKRTAEGLDATKTISCNVIAHDGEGMADANSMTKDFVDVPDYKERRESAKLCLQLVGHLQQLADNDDGSARVVVNMPIIHIDGRPMTFDVGEIVDVAGKSQ